MSKISFGRLTQYLSSALRPAQSEIRALTGIRGLGAIYVTIYHFAERFSSMGATTNNFIRHGYLSVDMFFILSGFVMAQSNAGVVSLKAGQPTLFLEFMYKRLARLYPLYFFVVLYAIIRAYQIKDMVPEEFVRVALSNLALIQSWGIAKSIGGPTWSLSLEWGAYILFPLLGFAFLRSNRTGFIVSISTAAGLVLAAAYFPRDSHQGYSGPLDLLQYNSIYPIFRCLGAFGLGIAANRLAAVRSVKKFFETKFLDLLIVGGMIVALAANNTDVVVVGLCVLLILSLAINTDAWVCRLIGSWPVWWLGMISYSIYLLHGFVIRQLPPLILEPVGGIGGDPWVVTCASVLILTVIVSSASYLMIEKPGRNMMMRMRCPRES